MEARVMSALPGTTETWFTGHLIRDRFRNKTLDEKASQLYKMAKDGLIFLLQKRVSAFTYEYRWVRTSNNIML